MAMSSEPYPASKYRPAALPAIPPTDIREGRLPAWARTLLDATRNAADVYRAAALQAQRDAARTLLDTNPATTDTLMDPWGVPVGLPAASTIHFRMDHSDYFDVTNQGGRLDIIASRSLVIDPLVSNHLRLFVCGRPDRREAHLHAPGA